MALDYSGAGGEIVLFTGKRTDIEETRIALNHTSKIKIGAIRALFLVREVLINIKCVV